MQIYKFLIFQMVDGAHTGEDVGNILFVSKLESCLTFFFQKLQGVFAQGPGANLIQGAFEQSYIPYVISFSTCIGPVAHENPSCQAKNEKLTNLGEILKEKSSLVLFLTLLSVFYHVL